MDEQERRESERALASFPVKHFFHRWHETGWARDLSCDGMRVSSRSPELLPGVQIMVRFAPPGGAEPVTCCAEVVHSAGGCVGLRFSELHQRHRLAIQRGVCMRKAGIWYY